MTPHDSRPHERRPEKVDADLAHSLKMRARERQALRYRYVYRKDVPYSEIPHNQDEFPREFAFGFTLSPSSESVRTPRICSRISCFNRSRTLPTPLALSPIVGREAISFVVMPCRK